MTAARPYLSTGQNLRPRYGATPLKSWSSRGYTSEGGSPRTHHVPPNMEQAREVYRRRNRTTMYATNGKPSESGRVTERSVG